MTEAVRIKARRIIQADAALNDSDKSFTVPTGVEWDIINVRISLIATATMGDRRLAVEVQDGSANVLMLVQAGIVQAESLTRAYDFAPGLADQTTFVNDTLNTALPKLILGPGEVLRLYDIAAIAAAADDMTVRVMIRELGGL